MCRKVFISREQARRGIGINIGSQFLTIALEEDASTEAWS